jgi:transcriptional regulator with XRE-family HTH domain
MSENSTIGFRIKQLRKELSLNQEDFVKDLGITRSALSQIESNTINPSLDLVVRIVSVFKVAPSWILVGAPDGYLNGYLNGYLDNKKTEIFSEELSGNAQPNAQVIPKQRPPGKQNSSVFCENCKQKQEVIDTQKELIEFLKEEKSRLNSTISELKDQLNEMDQENNSGQKRKAS